MQFETELLLLFLKYQIQLSFFICKMFKTLDSINLCFLKISIQIYFLLKYLKKSPTEDLKTFSLTLLKKKEEKKEYF